MGLDNPETTPPSIPTHLATAPCLLLLAPCRHPPPRLGRGPVSASVLAALRRAHAHPNRLVHPHLLAVAYLQSGVSANCRPGDYVRNIYRYHVAYKLLARGKAD